MLVKESTIWKLAKGNKKLLPEMYKMMRRIGKRKGVHIPSGHFGQKKFMMAYHSENTLPEIRAILLNMALNPSLDINIALQPYNKTNLKFTTHKITFSVIEYEGKYFINSNIHTPLKQFTKPISALQIPRSGYDKLLHTMSIGSLKEARYALWVDEYKHAWFALIEQFRTTIKANDVLKKYYDYDKNKEDKDYDRHPSVPDYKIERFIDDLEHIKSELTKFYRLQRYLGWDVSHIENQLDSISGKAKEILSLPIMDIESQLVQQYELFYMMSDTIADITDHLNMVSETTFEEIDTKIPKTFALPQFNHYSSSKSHIYRTKIDSGTFQDDIIRIKNFFQNRKAKL